MTHIKPRYIITAAECQRPSILCYQIYESQRSSKSCNVQKNCIFISPVTKEIALKLLIFHMEIYNNKQTNWTNTAIYWPLNFSISVPLISAEIPVMVPSVVVLLIIADRAALHIHSSIRQRYHIMSSPLLLSRICDRYRYT